MAAAQVSICVHAVPGEGGVGHLHGQLVLFAFGQCTDDGGAGDHVGGEAHLRHGLEDLHGRLPLVACPQSKFVRIAIAVGMSRWAMVVGIGQLS